ARVSGTPPCAGSGRREAEGEGAAARIVTRMSGAKCGAPDVAASPLIRATRLQLPRPRLDQSPPSPPARHSNQRRHVPRRLEPAPFLAPPCVVRGQRRALGPPPLPSPPQNN